MQIVTLERVKALKVGDSMVAYIGNFEEDIASCSSSTRCQAPAAKKLLTRIDDELKRLKLAGIIVLTKTARERKFEKGRTVRDFVYEVKRLIA
jgi:hypothetical protein